MSGIIIVKGQGVFTTEAVHDGFGAGPTRALSPGEVEKEHGPGVSPFDINPITRQKWGESGEGKHIVKDQFTAKVDEWTRKLKEFKPRLDEDAVRAELRKLLNDSTKEFNSHKHPQDFHRYPEEGIFLDINDPQSLNPVMHSNMRAPTFQKHARKAVGKDWLTKLQEVHPKDMKIRNHDGHYVDWTASNAMHDDHGHLTEAKWFGADNIFDRMVREGLKDPNSPLYLPGKDYSEVRPSTLAGLVTEPQALVFKEMQDGSHVPALQRYQRTSPATHGRSLVSRHMKNHGSHNFLNAWFTLHPSFFEPMAGSQDRRGAKRGLSELLLGENADPEVVNRLANTPAMALLAKHFPSFNERDPTRLNHSSSMLSRNSRTGNASHNLQLFNDMKYALGVPLQEYPGMPQHEQDALRFFNYNSKHIGIEPKFGNQELARHASADMAKLLAASLMVEHDEENRLRYRTKRGKASFADGEHMRSVLRSLYPDITPLDPTGFKWTPHEQIRTMTATPKAPFVPAPSPWAGDPTGGSSGAGQSVPPHVGLNLLNPPQQDDQKQASVDTLFDVMESLQSADAKMDSLILKSLPAKRRFLLDDSYDVSSLCDTYSLEERDLHYISQTMGDWDKIAHSLKVDTSVVKAVKVALTW